MPDRLHVSARHRRVLEALLREHLPDVEVWAYGSRVNGLGHDGSDLDLVLRGPGLEKIPIDRLMDFEEAVRESTIPFLVEARDWARLPERIHREIERGYVAVGGGGREHWIAMNLGLVCTKIGSGATPRGGKDVYLPSGPYALVRSQNIFNDGFRHAGLAYISERHASDLDGVEVLDGDVLLNITGDSVARACQIDSRILPARVNQHVAIVRPDPTKLDPDFLRYFLVCPETQATLLSWAGSGGTRNALTKAMIESFDVHAPDDLSEQRAIAHILGTLDDKIELNRRMNETLETMARALFKSWFVDFDPVRAKMEGRDTGLPQDIADLFPDRLVDSEMGEIPEGWEVATLGDVSVLRRQGANPTGVASDTPYIGLANMPRRSIALADWREAGITVSRKSVFKAADILFGKLRPYFHKVGIAPVDGLCSTDIVVLRARQRMWSSFVLACVSSSAFVAHTSQTATGTKMPRTSWKAMKRYEICRPTDEVVAEFQRHVTPILRRIVGNIRESRTLAALRDTLLPHLISGRLLVPAVDHLLWRPQ